MNTTTNGLASVSGISALGNFMVQSRRGGGYMVMRRVEAYGGWSEVAQSSTYGHACSVLLALVEKLGDAPEVAA